MNGAASLWKDGVFPRRLFFWLLPFLLVFRFWLAAALPITADEAYFIWWGKIPDWGFYDHPPMVGWWLAAQLLLGEGEAWLRLTSVLQPMLLSLAVAWFLPRIEPGIAEGRRWTAALLVLLSPAFVWNVLITTDTPLIYFSVLSGLCWLRARRDEDLRWYFAAGVFLAGAVLSKYFVAFLGFAYLVDVLLRPHRRAWRGLLLTYLCCVPGLALMAWWNAGHCWANYMFNFVNRNSDAHFSWQTPLVYAGTLLYLLTPPVVWGLMRRMPGPAQRSWGLLAYVPLALFAVLSLEKTVGLHWVLSFLPFALVLLALGADTVFLRRVTFFLLGFAVLHVALIVGGSFTRLSAWHSLKWYDSAVLAFDARKIARRLEPYAADYAFASNGYADAVTLGYNAGRYFLVFGEGSSHARHDDILTDFRALDGRNILILRKSAPAPGEYEPYFRELESKTFVLDGVTFHQIMGRGFRFDRYRDTVLATVRDRYYRIPAWLPRRACYFCERYWPEEKCP
ncbi:MAG: glycosyltransferase family 39 protein [Proteobacteria bacterium]|nr:glycosyltransferase family 39 protein [Pseudomonadota bacterium]HQR04770.1 glycosyltransferase family 39 protein [Rhodocyclaceae bacterium]